MVAWKVVGGAAYVIAVCVVLCVSACVNSERLWGTVDFLLFEVDNQNWNSEKKQRPLMFCQPILHEHSHSSVILWYLEISSALFFLTKSSSHANSLILIMVSLVVNQSPLLVASAVLSVVRWLFLHYLFLFVYLYLFDLRPADLLRSLQVIPVALDKEGTHWHTNTHSWINLTQLCAETQILLYISINVSLSCRKWSHLQCICRRKRQDDRNR